MDFTHSDRKHREIALSVLAAAVSVGLTGWLALRFAGPAAAPLLVASMGASAVLLYAVPSSPMSRPWPLLGGHLVSGLVGVSSAQWVPHPAAGAALAVGLALLAMRYLRCLHPPGGATALVCVVGGPQIQGLGYAFVAFPLAANVAAMAALAALFYPLVLRRRYFRPAPAGPGARPAVLPFHREDLKAALAEMGTFIDVGEEDLEKLYELALAHVQGLRLRRRRCGEVMSRPPVAVPYDTPLEEAWALMARHGIHGVVVVDPFRRVLGMVTRSDFLRHAEGRTEGNHALRLARLLRRTPGFHSDKPEAAGQIMSAPAVTAWEDETVAEVLPRFAAHRIHHLPVVDRQGRLVGMLTRADVLALLAEPSGSGSAPGGG